MDIHLFYRNQTFEADAQTVNVGVNNTDVEIRESAAEFFDVPLNDIAEFVVTPSKNQRETMDAVERINIRPQANFG